MGRQTMTLDEFKAACKAQAPSADQIVFKCPMCGTLQSARDLIAAGAGKDLDEVERYLAFSCVGRFTGAKSPRKSPDGEPCNWTLGGLFQTHKLEVVTPDGKRHPRFELATREEADAHRAVAACPPRSLTMRTTRYVFDQIEAKATVRWRDPTTGKPRQCTKRFMQTYNPFNKRCDGQIKSREEIRTEVNRDAQLWKLRTENDIRDGKFPGA